MLVCNNKDFILKIFKHKVCFLSVKDKWWVSTKGNENKVDRLAERVLYQMNYLELEVKKSKVVGNFCNLTIREMRNAFDETCHDLPTMLYLPPLKVKKYLNARLQKWIRSQ